MVQGPQDDPDLRSKVRSLTQYDDNEDELPQSDLDDIIWATKLDLKNETGSEAWYTDDGLGEALLYGTMIAAKVTVENYGAVQWSFGDETVTTTAEVPPEDSAQLQQWAERANNGMDSSSETTDGIPTMTSQLDFTTG